MVDLLSALKIAYTEVDVSVDTTAKEYMQAKSKANPPSTLPQIFVKGEYKGTWEEMEDSNECGEIKAWLGV